MSLWLILLFSTFATIHATTYTYCYKRFCLCRNNVGGKNIAICSGRQLTYIPKLPQHIIEVTMENTNLSGIRKDLFYNLTTPDRTQPFKKINLTGNLIDSLDINTFANLSHLAVLVLSGESSLDVNVLQRSLTSLRSKALTQLECTANGWNWLPLNMFKHLEQSKLRKITLNGNNLRFIDCKMFSNLRYLQKLYISDNGLTHLKLGNLFNLTNILLDGNGLPSVPKFCDDRRNSYVPKLQHLDLSGNGIAIIGAKSFQCLRSVKVLLLEKINVAKLENNIFSEMSELSTLQLTSPLKSIANYAFNSSTLKTLSLAACKFHFEDNEYNPATIFAVCPNLQHLDLTRNLFYFPKNFDKILSMIGTLTNLRYLSLEATWLSELPKHVFTKLKRLESLNLQSNHIKTWNNSEEIFGNMTSLRYLNLIRNSITLINETSFPKDILNSLQSLKLAQNPFSCTCEQMWFLEWMKSTNISLGAYPKFYKCAHPPDKKGLALKDYHPTDKLCNPWNSVYVITSSLSAMLALVITVSLIAVKCRSNIKNYIYSLRLYKKRRKGYLPLDNDTDYEYHAFVVYCDADRSWVHNQLLEKIENSAGMQLCIHHRNFDVGETITENVDKCLRKSYKVIVVMSNNFCKSEWCQWEVDVVQERRRKNGRAAVIPIMLENINTKHMTGKIRTLLDTTPYITYTKGVGSDLFWKTLIESLRKPLGHPPVSLL